MALSWPVDAPISQQFGTNPSNIQPNGHTGIDFAVGVGTPIYAADSGNIAWEGWGTNLSASNPWWLVPAYAGVVVVINHNDGFCTVYGHMESTVINNGDFVEKGQLIGYSGNTGLSSGPHLHFEVLGWPLQPYNGYYGRLNPNLYCGGLAQAPDIQPNQRVVGQYGVKERSGPSTASVEGRIFKHGDALTFKGYYRSPEGIWFVGAFTGTFFHSSAFDDSDTHDLPDLTPAAPPVSELGVMQRRVANDVAYYRSEPKTGAALVHTYKKGDIVNFSHWKRGDDVNGNAIWFKGAFPDGWAWSGAFENHGTDGLPEDAPAVSNPTPAPAPVPAPAPTPVPDKYSFTPDFDFVECIPAALPNFMFGNFPEKPEKAVIHQFGTPGVDTLTSTINTFTHPALERVASAHFVVSGDRIIQMVSLKDRAYHAGKGGNSWIGIETDPAQDEKTIASTVKLLRALEAKLGYKLALIRHREVPLEPGSDKLASTNCGALIDLAKYKTEVEPAPAPTPTPEPVPTPEPTPTPTPEPAPTLTVSEVIEKFQRFQRDDFLRNL